MKDFRLYDITDFVMDEDFIRWVQLNDPADKLFWENWLEQNPSRHLLVAEARQIVAFIQLEKQAIPTSEIQSQVAQLLTTIRQANNSADESPPVLNHKRSRSRFIRFALATAAILVTALVLTGIQKFTRPAKIPSAFTAPPPIQTALIEQTNATQEPVLFSLPDGSSIELAPGSRFRYDKQFTDAATRDVYLSGEAFFSIARNPAKPFRVLTDELITRVLGTSFSIRSFEKDTAISITVRTGRVSVWSQAEERTETSPEGHIVSPNQQLRYLREVRKFQKILIEKPLFIVSDTVDHSLTYEDTPVEQVFEQLARYYGISIVYDSELLHKCTVTADLANEPFYNKLDLICKAIGAHYEIVDAQVVIQSNGCQ